MTKLWKSAGEYAVCYAAPLVRRRLAALQENISSGDRGASAIELAIITALIAVAAAGVAAIIVTVIHSKASIIQGL